MILIKLVLMVVLVGLGMATLSGYLEARRYGRALRQPPPAPDPDPPTDRPPPACYTCGVAGDAEAEAVIMLEGQGVTVDGLSVDIRQALCSLCYQRERRQWQQEPPTRAVHWTDQGYMPTYTSWSRW